MSVRFSVVVIGKCSWPPTTRSIAGNRCASLRSSSNARCVTATMIEAPWAFNAGMYFAAAAKGSTRRVCVSRSRAISVVVSTSPMNPTFSAPNVFTKYGAAPPIGPGVDDVRDHPLPLRLAHALQQHIVAEIELVVAERGEIESGGVERGHHLLALEHARGH